MSVRSYVLFYIYSIYFERKNFFYFCNVKIVSFSIHIKMNYFCVIYEMSFIT